MSRKRKGRKGKPRPSSPLSAHAREGKKLVPPLMGLTNVSATPWLPDVFPDMLWLCSLVSLDLDDGMRAATAALNLIDEAVTQAGSAEPLVMDGRLTSLEAVPEQARGAAIERLQRAEGYEVAVPQEFAHALGVYPGAPGAWLIEPWREQGLVVDWEAAQRFLARVITDASHGQSDVATRAKFIALARWFKAGKIHVQHDSLAELFPGYPDRLTEEERKMAEAGVRAMFLAVVAMPAQEQRASEVEWGKEFWRSNWKMFPCSLPEDSPVASGEGSSLGRIEAVLRDEVEEMHARFLKVAQTADPDIYDPDRYEVLTGITAASIRAVAGVARTPLLWSAEHGLPILRSVVESLIVLRWLIKRDDSSMYQRFKDFGRGRLKLLKLHIEEYLDSQEEPSAELRRYAKYLEAEVNQDIGEEWQEISLEGTFSGLNMRKMAIEVGMESEYKFEFGPASAATHREWTVLDRFALERCASPLHRWHRVPRRELSVRIGSEIVESSLSMAGDLLDDYMRAVTRPRASK